MKYLSTFIIAIALTFFTYSYFEQDAIGVDLPSATATFETSLASGITANATTLTLTSNSVRGGGSLSGYQCFTIDEGTAQAEFVCGTASSTSVTGLERGISPSDGVTEDTDLQFSHRRGASVKITDFPLIQRLKSQNNGEGTFANALSYAAGVTPTGNNHLTDVEYVASVVNGGSISFDQLIITGNAGETVASGTIVYKSLADGEWYKADVDDQSTFVDVLNGIAQGAGTDGNAILGGILLRGIDSNQTGLSANTRYFLSSTAGGLQTATSGQAIGVSLSTTEIFFDPTFIETYFTASGVYTGNNTFSGQNTFSSTTTFSGAITFTEQITGHASTTVTTYTATTTWTKPDNLEYIGVWVCGTGGSGNAGSGSGGGSSGAGGGCAYEVLDKSELSATTSVQIAVNTAAGGSASFGNFLSATGGESGSAANQIDGGIGSGGDINLRGTGGYSPSGDGSAGGVGGSSFLGGGGSGDNPSGSGNAGSGGTCGGGGGGGGDTSSGNDGGGGSAGVGCVIIYEYY